jgi:ribosomal-protein-alanine N-acetyltransferase
MTAIELYRPTPADAEELLAFELDNRAYFEHWINARPASYYSLEAVRRAIDDAVRERAADTSHQFLIKAERRIVGRINLTGVVRPHFGKAMLGYRIAQACAGRGYASAAVALVLKEAFEELKLWRIEATARPENAGSVRVLERNGFTAFGRSLRSMWLRGQWYDLLQFERHNDIDPMQ